MSSSIDPKWEEYIRSKKYHEEQIRIQEEYEKRKFKNRKQRRAIEAKNRKGE
jgi:hypothetical protein